MVERLSAQLYFSKESRYSVESDHMDMVKFGSPRDKPFQTVVTEMEKEGVSE